MATKKTRKNTPMKNKTKAWRKMSKKEFTGEYEATTNIHTGEVIGRQPIYRRLGRQLKMFTVGYEGRKVATGLLASLINRLPDNKEFLKRYEKKVKDETK